MRKGARRGSWPAGMESVPPPPAPRCRRWSARAPRPRRRSGPRPPGSPPHRARARQGRQRPAEFSEGRPRRPEDHRTFQCDSFVFETNDHSLSLPEKVRAFRQPAANRQSARTRITIRAIFSAEYDLARRTYEGKDAGSHSPLHERQGRGRQLPDHAPRVPRRGPHGTLHSGGSGRQAGQAHPLRRPAGHDALPGGDRTHNHPRGRPGSRRGRSFRPRPNAEPLDGGYAFTGPEGLPLALVPGEGEFTDYDLEGFALRSGSPEESARTFVEMGFAPADDATP